jgi:hypothetical protein
MGAVERSAARQFGRGVLGPDGRKLQFLWALHYPSSESGLGTPVQISFPKVRLRTEQGRSLAVCVTLRAKQGRARHPHRGRYR